MAERFEPGHKETQKDLPGPLQSGWYPGTLALPATTISLASFLVLGAVFIFLQVGELSRALFRLPVPSGWTALAAAALAWGIAWACRKRPGRSLPRLWVLSLAGLATGVALVDLLGSELGQTPQIHALSLACLVASLTLSPRLFKLHPAHWLVQHIAPLGLAAALLIALPAALVFGRHEVGSRKQRVADTIVELTREAAEVREISAFDWSTTSERRQDALLQMRKLQELPLEQWAPDRYLWRGAALLGEEERLAEAYRALLDAVAEGTDPARTPKLWRTQFAWNRDAKRWETDAVFPELSSAIAGYHWRYSQMLQLLAPPEGNSEALRALTAYQEEKKKEAGERLARLSETWSEDWVPALVEAREPGFAPAVSPMVDLLQRPLLEDSPLRPASLQKLLGLKLGDARRETASAPGCGPTEYEEEDLEYFRVDCFAYTAVRDPEPGAALRVELRVVYKAEEALRPLSSRALPSEVYFLFPVPPGAEAAAYREDVMTALEAAAQEEHPDMELDRIDRTGPAKGFSFETGSGRRLRVVSYQIDDLGEGIPGIQVRAYYLDQSR